MENPFAGSLVGLSYHPPTKRDLLFFDSIWLFGIEPMMQGTLPKEEYENALRPNEIRHLIELKSQMLEPVVLQPQIGGVSFDALLEDFRDAPDDLRRKTRPKLLSWAAELIRNKTGIPTTPMYLTSELPSDAEGSQFGTVADVVIHMMPIPSTATPIEQLIEFRADSDSRSRMIDIVNWMRKIARESLSRSDVEEELRYLLNEYETRMRIHRMRYEIGTCRTLLTMAADVAENLARLRFTRVLDAVFTFKERHLQLREAELDSPGREVAYIAEARRRIGGGGQ